VVVLYDIDDWAGSSLTNTAMTASLGGVNSVNRQLGDIAAAAAGIEHLTRNMR